MKDTGTGSLGSILFFKTYTYSHSFNLLCVKDLYSLPYFGLFGPCNYNLLFVVLTDFENARDVTEG